MTIELDDLAGAEDDRRFSPNCWRVIMALTHKGLDCRRIPWRSVMQRFSPALTSVLSRFSYSATNPWPLPVVFSAKSALIASCAFAETR